jgi:hypothetical protein
MPSRPECHKALSLPSVFAARQADMPWPVALAEAEAGAPPGTLIHAPVTGVLEAALILAPDRPVSDETVLRLATLAVMRTLLTAVPPDARVAILAAGRIALNDGEVAAIALERGPQSDDGIADWLVLGFTLRLDLRLEAPGLTPWLTDLAEEGVEVSGVALLESLCRHLLSLIDLWHIDGEPGIARAWQAVHVLQAT